MALHEQYMLRVTAGATYDASAHKVVLVNSEKPMVITSDLIDCQLHMRIKDYRGMPRLLQGCKPVLLDDPLTLSRPARGLTLHVSILLLAATCI